MKVAWNDLKRIDRMTQVDDSWQMCSGDLVSSEKSAAFIALIWYVIVFAVGN